MGWMSCLGSNLDLFASELMVVANYLFSGNLVYHYHLTPYGEIFANILEAHYWESSSL
jgi:hypothetical protein